jgi:hypothetical protein
MDKKLGPQPETEEQAIERGEQVAALVKAAEQKLHEEPWEPSAWALQAAEQLLAQQTISKRQAALIIEVALLVSEDEVWDHIVASLDITGGGLNAENLYRFYYSKFLMMRDGYRRLMVRFKKLEAYCERRRNKADDAND